MQHEGMTVESLSPGGVPEAADTLHLLAARLQQEIALCLMVACDHAAMGGDSGGMHVCLC